MCIVIFWVRNGESRASMRRTTVPVHVPVIFTGDVIVVVAVGAGVGVDPQPSVCVAVGTGVAPADCGTKVGVVVTQGTEPPSCARALNEETGKRIRRAITPNSITE